MAGHARTRENREITAERRAQLAERWMTLAEERVAECLKGEGSPGEERAWATTAAIATDKAQLLSGQATQRIDGPEDIAALREELLHRVKFRLVK